MKQIPLTQDRFVLVDDEDYEYLNQWKWCFKASINGNGYAIRHVGPRTNNKRIWMHRLITNAPAGMEVDHINGDGLNNTKVNLRICTHQDNQRNRKRDKNAVGFKGVYPRKTGFRAQMTINGRTLNLGHFRNPLHAAMVYDLWALDIYGPTTQTNFKTII